MTTAENERVRVGDRELVARMAQMLAVRPTMGAMELQAQLHADGIACSLARVQRLSGLPSRGRMHATYGALVLARMQLLRRAGVRPDDELEAVARRHVLGH